MLNRGYYIIYIYYIYIYIYISCISNGFLVMSITLRLLSLDNRPESTRVNKSKTNGSQHCLEQ